MIKDLLNKAADLLDAAGHVKNRFVGPGDGTICLNEALARSVGHTYETTEAATKAGLEWIGNASEDVQKNLLAAKNALLSHLGKGTHDDIHVARESLCFVNNAVDTTKGFNAKLGRAEDLVAALRAAAEKHVVEPA